MVGTWRTKETEKITIGCGKAGHARLRQTGGYVPSDKGTIESKRKNKRKGKKTNTKTYVDNYVQTRKRRK